MKNLNATAKLILNQYDDGTVEILTEFDPEYRADIVAHDIVATIFSDLSVHFVKTETKEEK